jgi:hypothetical protein
MCSQLLLQVMVAVVVVGEPMVGPASVVAVVGAVAQIESVKLLL